MNKFLKIALLTSVFGFNVTAIKAQEDKISGIYVDGVKVTEIDCYSFGEMEIVFPIDKLKGIDLIRVYFVRRIDNSTHGSEAKDFLYSSLNMNSFKVGSQTYTRVKIYSKGKEHCAFHYNTDINYPYSPQIDRNEVYVKKSEEKKYEFIFNVNAKTISGYKEEYDNACSCIKKSPTYNEDNFKFFELNMKPNTNGNEEPVAEKKKGFKSLLNKEQSVVPINYDLACPVKGEKLEDLIKK